MKTCWFKRVLIPGLVASLAGCAHYPVNAPKTLNTRDGYYLRIPERKNNSDEILFLMAFSGGGTRAASLS